MESAVHFKNQIIADNRSAFNRIETFEKAETLFGYTCRDRSRMYPNSVRWELSVYENSNISGCITEGEIGRIDDMNVYANCSFAVAALGESDAVQQYNPYVFSNTQALEVDNSRLIGYLMDMESYYADNNAVATGLRDFIRDCELKLLYTEDDGILNESAMHMDIKLGGYDRVCMIDVLDTSRMGIVFPEQKIDATGKSFLSKCAAFVSGKDYRMYRIDKWKVAIAAPSFMVSLKGFSEDMKLLQRRLFETSEQFIAIVPVFCIINGADADTIGSVYTTARLEMMHKNVQFYVCDGTPEEIDEESIRERYHMVNVINYALSHDKVIPYFQGIYDNREKGIHHYESLIRLEDENGKVYYPGSFLDVARSFGLLYDELSRTMVRKVFEKFKDSPDRSVSINLGMRDIQNKEMTDYIYEFLATARYPGNFVFEILENEDVDDYELLIGFVDRIHKLGGLVSIDDFGSGYSNLQHLASIHSDYIKIDGSIVRNCCEDPESENLMSLAFAKAMEEKRYQSGRNRNFAFMINTVNHGLSGEQGLENVIRHFSETAFHDAALYLFEKPVEYDPANPESIPATIHLRCVAKDGNLFVVPKERREGAVTEIYSRNEIPYEAKGYTSFPLFYGKLLFGILVGGINRNLMETGEYLSFLLGKTIYTNLLLPG